MKIVAEVFKLAGGSLIPQFYGLRDDGGVDRGVSDTLLDLISESSSAELHKLDSLLNQVELGRYQPANTALPDWSSNDKNIWMTPPRAQPGTIVVSNENVPQLTVDDGQPQRFSIVFAREAIQHWLRFQRQIANSGAETLIGSRYETFI